MKHKNERGRYRHCHFIVSEIETELGKNKPMSHEISPAKAQGLPAKAQGLPTKAHPLERWPSERSSLTIILGKILCT